MGLNSTPSGERTHIGFFGMRNAGKSSVVNAVTGQDIAVVSDVKGTTTDPVYKSMELLPVGPVMIIDTPGIDDEGELGDLRVKKTMLVLGKTDVAVLVVDASAGLSEYDKTLISEFEKRGIKYITAYNKSDIACSSCRSASEKEIFVSAKTGDGINELKERIAKLGSAGESFSPIVSDLVKRGDAVILVTPIDSAAPKGRIILPQQQVLRDLLDVGAVPIFCRETELSGALSKLSSAPVMVITDSQAFGTVNSIVPKDIPLTSFSILMARHKGNLKAAIKAVSTLDRLSDGDRILISEGCTHHRQCGDIGTVKLPKMIRSYTGKNFVLEFSSGTGFPENLSGCSLVIHCGGCMLNAAEMKRRAALCAESGVPMTNYGLVIAYTKGIIKRSIGIFPEIET